MRIRWNIEQVINIILQLKIFLTVVKIQKECAAFLLLGHRGCGKVPELNRMSERLVDKGYYVKTVHCGMDLDLLNIVHSDLFILMGEALLQIAEELKCNIKKSLFKANYDFLV